MKRLSARPAIALLTFVVGVALVSVYLLLRREGHAAPPPPCNTVEVTTATAPVEQPTVEEETQSESLPDWPVKVGELPERGADERWGFSLAFVNEQVGWLRQRGEALAHRGRRRALGVGLLEGPGEPP